MAGGSLLWEERVGAALLLGHAIKQGPLAAGNWPQGGTCPSLSPSEAAWSLGRFHQITGALKGTKQVSTRFRALLQQHPALPQLPCKRQLTAPPRRAALPSATPLQRRLLQRAALPPTSSTAAMQKAASKMLLGAGSAACQGRQRRGLSATAAHARKRGLFCPETVPSSPTLWLCWPWGTPCPHPRQDRGGSTALQPQPWVPQSRG